MQAAINRGMHTYGVIVTLNVREEQFARGKVATFLAQFDIADER